MQTYTYRYVTQNIIQMLKQISTDSDINEVQVLFWVQIVETRLRAQHIIKKPLLVSGAHLAIFPSVPVIVDKTRTPAQKYIVLPAKIFDFPFDKAIRYISYELVLNKKPLIKTIDAVRVESIPNLYRNIYTSPSPKNSVRYRAGDRVYIVGIENIIVNTVEVGLLVAADPMLKCGYDDAINLPPELIEQLTYDVLSLGKFTMMIPKDRHVDGNDSTPEEGKTNTQRQSQQSQAQ